jgi:hypothetical protein
MIMSHIYITGTTKSFSLPPVIIDGITDISYDVLTNTLYVKGGLPLHPITPITLKNYCDLVGGSFIELKENGNYILKANAIIGNYTNPTYINFSTDKLILNTEDLLSFTIGLDVYSTGGILIDINSLAYDNYILNKSISEQITSLLTQVSTANTLASDVKSILNRVGLR